MAKLLSLARKNHVLDLHQDIKCELLTGMELAGNEWEMAGGSGKCQLWCGFGEIVKSENHFVSFPNEPGVSSCARRSWPDFDYRQRLIRAFESLRLGRGLPGVLRIGNGPEFLSGEFIAWAGSVGMTIQYIQPGEPNQNAYIEHLNKTYRYEVLDL